MTKRAAGYYPAIDYLRLFCALFVVLFHLAHSSTYGGLARLVVTPGLTLPEGIWFRYGWVGVQIFFVISGFVIAESAAKTTPWSFLRRRAERLYPAVWICAPVSALIWILHGRDVKATVLLLLKSLALIPGGEWVDAPYWTLACEIGFYAVVFLFIAIAGTRRLDLVALGLAVASVVFWLLFALETRYGLRIAASVFAGLKPIPIYYGAYFALGMLLYFRKSGKAVAGSSLAIAACLVVAGVESSLLLTRPEVASAIPTLLFLFGVAVIATARPTASPGRFARLCGLTTYPLYLLHFAAGLVVLEFFVRFDVPGFGASLIATVVMTLLAIVIATRLEPALRRVMSRAFTALEPALTRSAPGWLFEARS